jgi:hypothetical protein
VVSRSDQAVEGIFEQRWLGLLAHADASRIAKRRVLGCLRGCEGVGKAREKAPLRRQRPA